MTPTLLPKSHGGEARPVQLLELVPVGFCGSAFPRELALPGPARWLRTRPTQMNVGGLGT